MNLPSTHQQSTHELRDISKQRASKACNRCRAKKARCSGGYPCTKCKASDGVCIFGYLKKSKRKTFPEHYVRALEMQQYKLVAGLQTMYTMLLAANSWPGPHLTEHKGNPPVHDILKRLGLLEHEKDIDFELERGDHDHDHQPSPDGTSTADSPQSSHRGTEQSPESHKPKSADSPSHANHRQYLFTEADDTAEVESWHPQPKHSLNQSAFLSSQPSTELLLEPPPRMTPPFASTSPLTYTAGVVDWTAVSHPSAWWQGGHQTVRTTSSSSVGLVSALFATDIPADNDAIPACYVHNPFLVDPGVYASDFDVER